MTTTRTERARGVTLRTLDITKIVADVNEQLPSDADYTWGTSFEPWAMTEHNGRMYVVCCEGVSYEVTDEEPFELPLYRHSPGTVGIMPAAHAFLSPEEVRSVATDTEVDLADLIRVFGARLESNFWHLHRELTA